MGVLYSKSGFTKPAIKKAEANGIICCRLYENEPADLPSSIWIRHYQCKSALQLELVSNPTDSKLETWGDLFIVPFQETTVLDTIASVFSENEQKAVSVGNKQSSRCVA